MTCNAHMQCNNTCHTNQLDLGTKLFLLNLFLSFQSHFIVLEKFFPFVLLSFSRFFFFYTNVQLLHNLIPCATIESTSDILRSTVNTIASIFSGHNIWSGLMAIRSNTTACVAHPCGSNPRWWSLFHRWHFRVSFWQRL